MDSFNVWDVAKYVVGGSLLVVVAALAKPILFPTIIKFPWEDVTGKEDKIVILAGSYNPPHLGHLAMLEYLSKRYKRVIAVVGFNPNKTYLVAPEQRKDLLEKILQNTSATNIYVDVVDGYIWRYAKRIEANMFYRGIRNWDKDGADERALQILNTWGPILLGPLFWPIPTQYLEGNPKYNHVSSTLIRDLCKNKGTDNQKALVELVPANVADLVSNFYCPKDE